MSNPTYMAYLLRLWRDDDEAPWRAMLEAAPPAERTLFATLTDLAAYLEYRTGDRIGGDEPLRNPSQGHSD